MVDRRLFKNPSLFTKRAIDNCFFSPLVSMLCLVRSMNVFLNGFLFPFTILKFLSLDLFLEKCPLSFFLMVPSFRALDAGIIFIVLAVVLSMAKAPLLSASFFVNGKRFNLMNLFRLFARTWKPTSAFFLFFIFLFISGFNGGGPFVGGFVGGRVGGGPVGGGGLLGGFTGG